MQRKHPSLAFLIFPFLWTAVEFLRSFGILGFPWPALGHSQAYNTLYVQMADIGGVYTLSFMLLLSNLFLYLLIRTYSRQRLTALILAVLIPYCYGLTVMNLDMQGDRTVNFRIVQPNIGAKEKWKPSNREAIMQKMDSLSRAQTGTAPEVIVWPETAVPFYLRSSRYYKHIIIRCARDMQSTLITGSLDYFFPDTVSRHASTNSVFVFEPGAQDYQEVIYDKIHLVPFGEFTPGEKYLSWLNNMEYGQSDFATRKTVRVMHMGTDRIAFTPMICYDSVFPHTVRRAAAEGSKYNILITNDVWFGRSMGPHQHAAIAILRAVETRRPLVRSANAGISMFIDAKGRVLKSLPLYTSGILDQELPSGIHVSPYVKTGNLFSWIAVIISAMGICFSLCLRRKK
ncbi:MAG: apolipoprotein N-acyltransferase [Candidatus Marinimicrobia bacterium]|nr:apolipoprotein N-acyltransferase [Candidatus Neomarinimicrobiota bacterium]